MESRPENAIVDHREVQRRNIKPVVVGGVEVVEARRRELRERVELWWFYDGDFDGFAHIAAAALEERKAKP
ncbi:unnamed protein product [Camellia sinensis]